MPNWEDEVLQRIHDEIENEPTGKGYSGMNNPQIADSMNNAWVMVVSSEIARTPRICEILSGVDTAPNSITAAQIAQAKQL